MSRRSARNAGKAPEKKVKTEDEHDIEGL